MFWETERVNKMVERAIFDVFGQKAGFQLGGTVFDIHGMRIGNLVDCNRSKAILSKEECPLGEELSEKQKRLAPWVWLPQSS